MASESLKGLEFVLIVGVVVWFYFAQTRNLRRLREEREAKQDDAPASTTTNTERKAD